MRRTFVTLVQHDFFPELCACRPHGAIGASAVCMGKPVRVAAGTRVAPLAEVGSRWLCIVRGSWPWLYVWLGADEVIEENEVVEVN